MLSEGSVSDPSSDANQSSDLNILTLQVLNAMYLKSMLILMNLASKVLKIVKTS